MSTKFNVATVCSKLFAYPSSSFSYSIPFSLFNYNNNDLIISTVITNPGIAFCKSVVTLHIRVNITNRQFYNDSSALVATDVVSRQGSWNMKRITHGRLDTPKVPERLSDASGPGKVQCNPPKYVTLIIEHAAIQTSGTRMINYLTPALLT